jgi:hypothetical protein
MDDIWSERGGGVRGDFYFCADFGGFFDFSGRFLQKLKKS